MHQVIMVRVCFPEHHTRKSGLEHMNTLIGVRMCFPQRVRVYFH